ncbi:MAG: hypothetical protein P8186_33040 [Anaerolineae bacterium]
MAAANQGVPYMLIAHTSPLAQATMTLGRHLISTTAEKVGADEESGEVSGKAALSRTLG